MLVRFRYIDLFWVKIESQLIDAIRINAIVHEFSAKL